MRADQIIQKPIITEKTSELAGKKVYAFAVHPHANKDQIAEQISRLFKVEVESVRISIQKGKTKRTGRRMIRKPVPAWKKAYVTVKNGSIAIFPQI